MTYAQLQETPIKAANIGGAKQCPQRGLNRHAAHSRAIIT
jgi:hypothetical protein